jgi:tRNA(Ile)-lysidine synthase
MKSGWQWGHVSNLPIVHLTQDWQRRLSQYTRLYIGYSGGLDSTVLLSIVASCPELQSKVIAVHVHHGLSTHADNWVGHCQQFCRRLNVPCEVVRVAVTSGANLEERARIARYQAFDAFIENHDALLLAHHQNDQSETVLLNLFRGAGLDGLCAMPEERACGKGVLIRPLLHYPRQALSDYAQRNALQWIEDEMNADCEWSRVYLRQKIIPLLQTKWPNLSATVAASAQHCQEAKKALEDWMAQDCPEIRDKKLEITDGLQADSVRCTYLLRVWLKQHLQRPPSRACIQQIVKTVIFAGQDATPSLQIEDWTLRRYQQTLYLVQTQPNPPKNLLWHNFPQPIAWSEHQYVIATRDEQGIFIPHNSCIELKVREGGETLHWHGQTQSMKKLLQTWHIPPWQRACLPLVYVNGQLMAVPDYAQSDWLLSEGPGERYTMTTSRK